MNHNHYIEQTLHLARSARRKGNHPFGALLVHDNRILLRSENTVVTQNDATQHAELRLVSKASRTLTANILTQSILYTSTEPCAMCAGAIYWAGIRRVVFGLSALQLGTLTTASFVVEAKNVFSYGREHVELTGPVMTKQCARVHQHFWKTNDFLSPPHE